MEKYNKLVRDNIPDILDKKGVSYEKRIANDDEYKVELIKKLREEVDEFMEAADIEELADILEVIDSILGLEEYKNVRIIQSEKRFKRGGFDKRIILKGEK